jgi:hypothetical protein
VDDAVDEQGRRAQYLARSQAAVDILADPVRHRDAGRSRSNTATIAFFALTASTDQERGGDVLAEPLNVVGIMNSSF